MDGRRGPTWRPGLRAATDAARERRRYQELLEALVRREELPRRRAALERNADAAALAGEVLAREEREIERDELVRARLDAADFQAGLERARGAGEEAPFDSADPDQDRLAGVLIHYLVTTGYASVRTEERSPERRIYHIAVDWPKLEALASSGPGGEDRASA